MVSSDKAVASKLSLWSSCSSLVGEVGGVREGTEVIHDVALQTETPNRGPTVRKPLQSDQSLFALPLPPCRAMCRSPSGIPLAPGRPVKPPMMHKCATLSGASVTTAAPCAHRGTSRAKSGLFRQASGGEGAPPAASVAADAVAGASSQTSLRTVPFSLRPPAIIIVFSGVTHVECISLASGATPSPSPLARSCQVK